MHTNSFSLRRERILGAVCLTRLPFFLFLLGPTIVFHYILTAHHRDEAVYTFWSMLVIVIGYVLTIFGETQWVKARTPETILLAGQAIYLNQQSFAFDTIAKIYLTPPSYRQGTITRKLTIFLEGKEKCSWLLGFKRDSRAGNPVFPEYEAFAHALEQQLLSWPGKFQYDR